MEQMGEGKWNKMEGALGQIYKKNGWTRTVVTVMWRQMVWGKES